MWLGGLGDARAQKLAYVGVGHGHVGPCGSDPEQVEHLTIASVHSVYDASCRVS